MSLQQNQIIGEIVTDAEGFYVDACIHTEDRSRIAVEQPVNVAIIGVNNYRFGTATVSLSEEILGFSATLNVATVTTAIKLPLILTLWQIIKHN